MRGGRFQSQTRVPVFMAVLMAVTATAAEFKIVPADRPEDVLPRLRPGDVLTLGTGVYENEWTIAGLKGTPAAPITIRGEKGAVFQVQRGRDGIVFWGAPSEHIAIENLRFERCRRGGVVVYGATDIAIRDCVFVSNGVWGVQSAMCARLTLERCELAWSAKEHGAYFSTTDQPVVRDCRVHDNAGCGIHFNGDISEGGDGMITGALVEKNVIFKNGRAGGAAINMDGVENSIIRGNTVCDNLAGGIVSFVQNGARSGSGNRFLNNTVRFPRGVGRFGIGIYGQAHDTAVEGNVLACGKGPALEITDWPLEGWRSDRNLFIRFDGIPLIRVKASALDIAGWKRLSGQDRNSTVDGATEGG